METGFDSPIRNICLFPFPPNIGEFSFSCRAQHIFRSSVLSLQYLDRHYYGRMTRNKVPQGIGVCRQLSIPHRFVLNMINNVFNKEYSIFWKRICLWGCLQTFHPYLSILKTHKQTLPKQIGSCSSFFGIHWQYLLSVTFTTQFPIRIWISLTLGAKGSIKQNCNSYILFLCHFMFFLYPAWPPW